MRGSKFEIGMGYFKDIAEQMSITTDPVVRIQALRRFERRLVHFMANVWLAGVAEDTVHRPRSRKQSNYTKPGHLPPGDIL